jgi:hypothetical protein
MSTIAQQVSDLMLKELQGVMADGFENAIALVEADFGRALTDDEKANGFSAIWPIVKFTDGSACDFSGEWAPTVL